MCEKLCEFFRKPFGLDWKNWFVQLLLGLFITSVDMGLIAVASIMQPLMDKTGWSMEQMSILAGAPYL